MNQTSLRTVGIGLVGLGVIIGFTVPTNLCRQTTFLTGTGHCHQAPSPFVAIVTWTLIVAGAVLVALALQARDRR